MTDHALTMIVVIILVVFAATFCCLWFRSLMRQMVRVEAA